MLPGEPGILRISGSPGLLRKKPALIKAGLDRL
jgi:hypothetical protein